MKVVFTDPFQRDYCGLPSKIQKALDKALKFLLENPRYPSLRSKKLPGTVIWYARVSRNYRFTFQIQDDLLILRRAGAHNILDSERKN